LAHHASTKQTCGMRTKQKNPWIGEWPRPQLKAGEGRDATYNDAITAIQILGPSLIIHPRSAMSRHHRPANEAGPPQGTAADRGD
jgi:hypothetical protein